MSGGSLTAHCNVLPGFLLQQVGIVDTVVSHCDLHKRVLVMRRSQQYRSVAGVTGILPSTYYPINRVQPDLARITADYSIS